jgi:glyoxylase-like metal-dependent hydrolase (beta-lactamase superfamily II)
MRIIPLSEGTFTIDHTKLFVPFDDRDDQLTERSPGSLLVEIQPFVIQTHHEILLLDAGLGFKNPDGVQQIHQNLIDNGINPLDITKVLMTHLHKDHAGGLTVMDTLLNRSFLSFPNATYYIQKKEFDYAFEKGLPSYIPEELEGLKDSGQLMFLEGNGLIDDYIRYQITSAHSPFHQVFWIMEGEEIVFFGGDDAPQLQQMKNRFIAKYDYDGKKCMELRQQWWQAGKEEHWTFLFYHDVKHPFVKL